MRTAIRLVFWAAVLALLFVCASYGIQPIIAPQALGR